MQFINNGPDIPDALLQAHEEGRVVFFCGAGISYPAGLPGFKGLVERIYDLLRYLREPNEEYAFKREQYDATLDLLERRFPGQRLAVRSKLAQALKPNLRRKGATDTHAALLRLARSREGALRLVTTNFDRLFHVAAKRIKQAFQPYAAPMLPIPKNSRWNGLVYLHGFLPEKPDDSDLNRLVITSGDFGLAYLTERWAARFVSELFRNYVVCFVGYSINDPVLRYMMDALAADRMLGEDTPQAWAFGDSEPDQKSQKKIEWEAKGVTPILYEVPAGGNDHSALHQTLQAWANIYRDGVQGKEAIVVRYALASPQDSTQQDDFVGRMLWALSDKSGLPAKRFADFNPVPSLDWLLGPFSDELFGHADLARFGVPTPGETDEKLRFSLIRRPAHYDRAPFMCLAFGGTTSTHWDDVMTEVARWLTRHLNDLRLILWIAHNGGRIHHQLKWLIEQKLNEYALLELDKKEYELKDIRSQAPMAIPSRLMQTLWRVLLGDRVKSPSHKPNFYGWVVRLNREGLTTTMRLELRELLKPQVTLEKPFYFGDGDLNLREPSRMKQLVSTELELATINHVNSTLRDFAGEHWKSALPLLLEDVQQLLRDALDLLRELDEADNHHDPSCRDMPSISSHQQNRGLHNWTSLIEILREAWLAVYTSDSAHATRIAQNWFELPYPTFKRLALFAASKDDCIPPKQWVEWLQADNAWWLWSIYTKREVCRLFVLQGQHLKKAEQKKLEETILAGPPRVMCPDGLTGDQRQNHVSGFVWLRLVKLKTSLHSLGTAATKRLTEISNTYPDWKLAKTDRDEFSYWLQDTNNHDIEENQNVIKTPRKRKELVQWLQSPKPEPGYFEEDNWREVCRRHLLNSLCALHVLAQINRWPANRWSEALYIWAEKGMELRSWQYAAPVVQTLPNHVLQEISHSVTWWMEAVSKSINRHENILLELCSRVLALQIEVGGTTITLPNGNPIDEPVTSAINHPVGHVTQALINLWFKQNPNDNELLPANIKAFFTSLCDVQVERYRHGRVLLGSQLIALFRVDRPWTEQHLLPLFSWNNLNEAKAVWDGFLLSPRLYQPLMTALKPHLLESANHYQKLGERRMKFAAFLTYAALGPIEGYTAHEFRSAIGALPIEGLEYAAQAFSQAVEGAAEQSEDYWNNRALPFWQLIWPKYCKLATPSIAESLARVAMAVRSKFPAALACLKDWLQPINDPHEVVLLLNKSGLCKQFPQDALLLLDAVIAEPQWPPRKLGECLNEIIQAAPNLAQDSRYQRLHEYSRKRGA